MLGVGLANLIFVGGLQVELPDTPDLLAGAHLELRWAGLPGVHVGGRVGWSGGADETNPEAPRIVQRIEAVGLLGAHLDLDSVVLRADLLTGMSRVEGWPFGALPRRSQFSPTLGARLGAALPLGAAWGHPLFLDLSLGGTVFRLGETWIDQPVATLGLAATLDRVD